MGGGKGSGAAGAEGKGAGSAVLPSGGSGSLFDAAPSRSPMPAASRLVTVDQRRLLGVHFWSAKTPDIQPPFELELDDRLPAVRQRKGTRSRPPPLTMGVPFGGQCVRRGGSFVARPQLPCRKSIK